MTSTINSTPLAPSLYELSFSFSPSAPITIEGSPLLTGESGAAGTALTFTAVAVLDNSGNDLDGIPVITEYRWLFGDGAIGYGNPVIHTYQLAQPVMPVILRARDSLERFWQIRQNVYLT